MFTGALAAAFRGIPAAAPEQGTILFAAQWRSAGTGASEVTDNSRFQTWGTACTVVSAASTGFSGWPTTNVLRVSTDVAAGARITIGTLPDVSNGASRYYRIYLADTQDDIDDALVEDNSAHPIENVHDGTGGGVSSDEDTGIGTWWRAATLEGESLWPNWNPSFMANDGSHFKYATNSSLPQDIITLPINTVFRFEWAVHRINATTYTMDARIYNAAGDLIADEDNFYLATVGVLAGRVHTFDPVSSLRAFACGSNQSNYFSSGASPSSYQAAVAISDTGWLGAYNAATEANWDA